MNLILGECWLNLVDKEVNGLFKGMCILELYRTAIYKVKFLTHIL